MFSSSFTCINCRLITALPGRTRMRVTWRVRHPFWAQLLISWWLPSEVFGIYQGSGEKWRLVGGAECPPRMAAALSEIEELILKRSEEAENEGTG
jgi:hypothetical protein